MRLKRRIPRKFPERALQEKMNMIGLNFLNTVNKGNFYFKPNLYYGLEN